MADTHDTHDPPDDEAPGELIQLPCQPDRAVMADMVATLFRHSVHGLIELAWTTPAPGEKARAKLNSARLFGLDDDSREALVEFAADLSTRPSFNLYISVGLRREDVPRAVRHGRDALLSVAAIKADCDTPGCLTHALAICEELHIRPSYVMFTGRYPHLRGSLWWVLDQPAGLGDFPAIEALERRLAQLFGSDSQVVDPSRVMRLAGSVAWPIKKDRTLEMTGAYAPPTGTRAAPYTLEEMAHRTQAHTSPAIAPMSPAVAALDLSGAKATHEYSALVTAAGEPHNWHKSARDLTGHLIGRGCPPDVVLDMLTPALTQPGYSLADTRADLATMVKGAVEKGWATQPAQVSVQTPVAPLFMTTGGLLDMPPVEWMIEGYLPTQGMSALFAPPSAFKSFLALDMGMSVAYGLPWHGLATRQRKTLYLLAEGKHGFGQRARVWQEHRAGGCDTDQFLVLPTAVNMLNPDVIDRLIAAIREQLGAVGFIIADTLARNFGSGDENSTKDMNAYVLGSAKLAEAFGAHLMHVHHTGKDEGKGERGSSALLGALDTSLKLVRDGQAEAATLYVKKQKDGPEARPMRLSFPLAEGSHPSTGELFHSRIPTLAGEPDEPPEKGGGGLSKAQLALLELVRTGMSSLSVLATALNTDRSNVRRSLMRLQERELVQQGQNGFWTAVVVQNSQSEHDDEL